MREGCDLILTAAMDDGRLVSLAEQTMSAAELHESAGKFRCPACHAPVILKTGKKKRWHFSHSPGRACLIESEPESDTHLSGKADLFRWASENGRSPLLECYLPKLRQRPDVFLPGIRPIALEYQCSVLPEQTMAQRTSGYLRHGIEPVWLLGGIRLKQRRGLLRLTGFESMTIRQAGPEAVSGHPFSSAFYACFYKTEESRVFIAAHLHPLSETRFLAQTMTVPLTAFRPYELIRPLVSFSPAAFKNGWLNGKRRYRLLPSARCGKSEYRLRQLAYRSGRPFSEFPAYVGLPHALYMHLCSPPLFWQMWLDLWFHRFPSGTWMTPLQMVRSIDKRDARTIFKRRALPICPRISLEQIIEIYLDQLVLLGVSERRGRAYRLCRCPLHSHPTPDRLMADDGLMLDRLETRSKNRNDRWNRGTAAKAPAGAPSFWTEAAHRGNPE